MARRVGPFVLEQFNPMIHFVDKAMIRTMTKRRRSCYQLHGYLLVLLQLGLQGRWQFQYLQAHICSRTYNACLIPWKNISLVDGESIRLVTSPSFFIKSGL